MANSGRATSWLFPVNAGGAKRRRSASSVAGTPAASPAAPARKTRRVMCVAMSGVPWVESRGGAQQPDHKARRRRTPAIRPVRLELMAAHMSPGTPFGYDAAMNATVPARRIRVGMAGLGMIFDETYRPVFEQLHADGLYRRDFGPVEVELAAVASRTGSRAERLRQSRPRRPLRQLRRPGRRAANAGARRRCRLRRHAGRPPLRRRPPGPRRRQARPDREAVGAALAGAGRTRRPGPQATACSPRSSTTSWPTPTTRSCAPTSSTACCGTSTTAIAPCWSRNRSAASSSPSGSSAAIPELMSPSTTSS